MWTTPAKLALPLYEEMTRCLTVPYAPHGYREGVVSRTGFDGDRARVRRLLSFRCDRVRVCSDWFEEPLGAGVREPRRPRLFGPGGVMMLDLPDTE